MTTRTPSRSRSAPQDPASRGPVVLCILDGWGLRDDARDNALAQAALPHWQAMTEGRPPARIATSGAAVGLPDGQMGNSEVGHMTIGAGRIPLQDLPRIDAAIADGSFARIPALQDCLQAAGQAGGCLHVLGLLSPGGVHSHQRHVLALAEAAAASGLAVRIHALLDGRDTPPQSARAVLPEVEAAIGRLNAAGADIRIATVCGRYFGMDRDKRWDRVALAYAAMVDGRGVRRADTAMAALEAAYAAGETDEFVRPAAIGDYAGMRDGDAAIMANFRADRARELMTALVDPQFDGFARRLPELAAVAGMASYSAALDERMGVLFPSMTFPHTLGACAADAGLRQIRIAETEKYAHVTFFLNGGEEACFPGEERAMVPSPKVATYDLQPEMSAAEVTDRVVEALDGRRFGLIVVNYANPDMVGHTGKLPAAIRAAETVDACLGRLVAAVGRAGGAMLVTADHGNLEEMRDPESGAAHTQHTTNPVPALLVGPAAQGQRLADGGLADIAPTLLDLLGLARPDEMTGRSLLRPAEAESGAAGSNPDPGPADRAIA